MIFDTRTDLVRNLVRSGGVIAEVGVLNGEFSKELIGILNPSRIYMIDQFEGRCFSGDRDGNNGAIYDLNAAHSSLVEYAKLNPAVTILKGDSSTLLDTLEANSLDMIYLDGDHEYEGCKKDVIASHRLLKPGGWLMGHDYTTNPIKALNNYVFGVKKAIDEFCCGYNQTIHALGNDGMVSFAIKISK
jgi:hypothetical protein